MYDIIKNQTSRTINGQSYTLAYDAENRLVSVSGAATATFVYDGDGNRVKTTLGGVNTVYMGGYFEWTGSTSTMKRYYYAGGQRVAVRTGTTNSVLRYLLGDHLGSTSLTVDTAGAEVAEIRYMPWGGARYTSGSTPTTFHYTGQREQSEIGLYFYNARWYDAALGRFAEADSIIPNPGDPASYDRYAYTRNNPVRYTDPSGRSYCDSPYADPEDCAEIDDSQPPLGNQMHDLVTLTHAGEFNGYDGQMMYELYLLFRDTPGFWNNQGMDTFTVRDFLVLILYFEMGGITDNWDGSLNQDVANSYAEAVSRKLRYWCAQYSQTGSCATITDNAILNYLATRGSAWKAYDAYITRGEPIRGTSDSFYNWNYDNARTVVDMALKPTNTTWLEPALWDFGNLSMFPQENWNALTHALTGTTARDGVFWRSEDGIAYVMTDEQIAFWLTVQQSP